jgi:carbohydrate-selective porin OprB
VSLACGAAAIRARGSDAAAATNPAPHDLLLDDNLGQLLVVPSNSIPANLLPPAKVTQIPAPARGAAVSEPVQRRLLKDQEKQTGSELFPSAQPWLMPYLGANDELGNTAIRVDPLISTTPWDGLAQQLKYELSLYGLRYSLKETFTVASMSNVKQGSDSLAFFTFDFPAKWTVYSSPGESAGWISSQIEAKTGLNSASQTESPQSNMGTLTDPSGIWSGVNGVRVPELAWQQSLAGGRVVGVAGVVNQANYFDANTYANSGRGQYLNSALINSMVMPLPSYNLGGNLQWQPLPEWYAMVGASVGKARAGQLPWVDFTWNSWTVLGEIGYTPADFLGFGPGAYRILPFIAQAHGVMKNTYTITPPGSTNSTSVTVDSSTNSAVQGGLCFNLQQQLGEHSPLAWFGRFGLGGSEVSAGASAQIGTGFGMRGPLALAKLWPSRKNDTAGIGFVWSQPSWTQNVPAYRNEYVMEAGYVLQLTPLARIQPDIQYVWNPANNPTSSHAVIFQLQIDIDW